MINSSKRPNQILIASILSTIRILDLNTYNFTLNFISSICVAGPQTTFTKTGTIIVNNNPTVSIVADYCAVNNRVRLTATPVPTGTYSFLWSNGSTRDTAQVTTGGNFTISISNTFGCKSIASYSVGTEISINGNFNNGNTNINHFVIIHVSIGIFTF